MGCLNRMLDEASPDLRSAFGVPELLRSEFVMVTAQSTESNRRKPLRLWPGVAAVAVQWIIRFGVPVVWPEAIPLAILGGLAGGLAVIVWWGFFSRAPRADRLGGVVLIVAALALTPLILHASVATGMMGMMFAVYAIPVISLAFVGAAVACRGFADGPRRLAMVAALAAACGGWALVRTGGITSNGGADFAWRWSPTPEDLLLAQADSDRARLSAAPEELAPEAEWPGFRGPNRDGVVRGVSIAADWAASPPVELWRRPVGPAWSSFAVQGGLIYTQEQRGEEEVVSCYNATTGEPVWRRRDATRFWESNAGAGPRATPTLSGGRVYTLGGTGLLNALDAADGSVVWSRNAAGDSGAKTPDWGFSSSPLVVDDVVLVYAGALLAYDLATGNPRWSGPAGDGTYSSPHLSTLDGVQQVLMLSGAGAASYAPGDGALLWQYPWPSFQILQPALTSAGDVLIGGSQSTGGAGVRRVSVAHEAGGWSATERWTSRGLKPYFNDFVVHKGHVYGFDGRILSCIDLETGERKWKGGRYGQGQFVLLAGDDLLLVLSEEGELALVGATPDAFTEVARFPAIEGKTWNHPVVVGDLLLVRNSQEMAAFRLALRPAAS